MNYTIALNTIDAVRLTLCMICNLFVSSIREPQVYDVTWTVLLCSSTKFHLPYFSIEVLCLSPEDSQSHMFLVMIVTDLASFFKIH